jgi:hypothetical protein
MDQGEGTPPAQDTEGNKEQAPTPAETHDTAINSKSAQAESQSSQKKKNEKTGHNVWKPGVPFCWFSLLVIMPTTPKSKEMRCLIPTKSRVTH